jgi:hypothetical protein
MTQFSDDPLNFDELLKDFTEIPVGEDHHTLICVHADDCFVHFSYDSKDSINGCRSSGFVMTPLEAVKTAELLLKAAQQVMCDGSHFPWG